MASGDSGDSPSKVATAAMGRGWDVRVHSWPAVYCPRQVAMAEMSFYLLWP